MRKILIIVSFLVSTVVFSQEGVYLILKMPESQYNLGLFENMKYIDSVPIEEIINFVEVKKRDNNLIILEVDSRSILSIGMIREFKEHQKYIDLIDDQDYFFLESYKDGFFVIDDMEGNRFYFIKSKFPVRK